MSFRKRAAAFLCAVCVLVSMVSAARPVPAYASGLSDQLEQARREQEELEARIDAVRADKDKVTEQKALLDQRNEQLRIEMNLIQQQYDETENRITELTEKEKQQYELFCRQVREEEERGTVSFWSVLFKAASFTDLLARVDFINEVMDYDRQVISQLQETRSQLAQDKTALAQQKDELAQTRQALQEKVAEAASLISEYEQTEAGHQKMLEQAEEDEARIRELIRKQEEQERQNEKPSVPSNGYIWPTNATRLVTSPYGWRVCPFHGNEYHNGSDIGAAWGTEVLAANSGTVIQAGWNGGYGISVMIAHSDGITTLYGHMSDWNVSEGQTVSQGEVIGWCGSTGNSDGPHIHYTMYKNGETINSLDYLPGYIAYDW